MTGTRLPAGPAVLGLEQIQAVVTLPAAVAAVEASFRALAAGQVRQPPPMGVDLPGGDVHVKAAQLGPGDPLVVKVATGFPGGARLGLPTGDGVMVVLDAGTGRVTALLLDQGWLTDVRTAAATAVAVRLLSPEPARRLALLGTGVQARLTLLTLDAAGCLPEDVVVWGRTADHARRLVDDQDLRHRRLRVAPTAADAVRGADVVVTATAAREPVLHGDGLDPDALVVAVGADSPGKRECDGAVLRRAAQVAVDDLGQALRLGELQHAGAPPARVDDVGVLLTGPTPARRPGVCLCDLTGVGAHDAALAGLVLA